MVPPSLAQRLGAEPGPEPEPTTAAVAGMWTEDEKCTLHVRMIGVGGCKSETSLRQVFSPYGSLVSATVRVLPCRISESIALRSAHFGPKMYGKMYGLGDL